MGTADSRQGAVGGGRGRVSTRRLCNNRRLEVTCRIVNLNSTGHVGTYVPGSITDNAV